MRGELPPAAASAAAARRDDEPTDHELLAALAYDPRALDQLYDRHASLVYGLALAVLRDRSEAEDLSQEIFVALYEDDGFDPTRGTFPAYLIAMTRSRAIDRLRRGGRRLRVLQRIHQSEPAPSTPSPHQTAAAREIALRVRGALADLGDREREVLELSYYRDMTQAEIADHLGAPLGSVKSWARRGLLRLQGQLKDLT